MSSQQKLVKYYYCLTGNSWYNKRTKAELSFLLDKRSVLAITCLLCNIPPTTEGCCQPPAFRPFRPPPLCVCRRTTVINVFVCFWLGVWVLSYSPHDLCTWDSQAWLLPLVRTKITAWKAPPGPNPLQIACWAVQVTLRSWHWCRVCWQGPLPICWLCCCSKPTQGLAWDECLVACVAVCSRCVTLWTHTHAANVADLQTGTRVYVWAGPWLWSCASEGWSQNVRHEASSSSRELSLVAVLLFRSPSAQPPKSGNLCLPTWYE